MVTEKVHFKHIWKIFVTLTTVFVIQYNFFSWTIIAILVTNKNACINFDREIAKNISNNTQKSEINAVIPKYMRLISNIHHWHNTYRGWWTPTKCAFIHYLQLVVPLRNRWLPVPLALSCVILEGVNGGSQSLFLFTINF